MMNGCSSAGFEKPSGMSQSAFENYIKDGFSNKEIWKIWEDTLISRNLMNTVYGRNRDVTSSTYEKAQKVLNKKVENFLGIK